ncbi:hypothetical protein O988_07292 [Pseudogymnoascus sp. VKM F-3808]|nr:hypothetical protein O988_07292 [Pseudogymnoascus sp. VKM F-3808]
MDSSPPPENGDWPTPSRRTSRTLRRSEYPIVLHQPWPSIFASDAFVITSLARFLFVGIWLVSWIETPSADNSPKNGSAQYTTGSLRQYYRTIIPLPCTRLSITLLDKRSRYYTKYKMAATLFKSLAMASLAVVAVANPFEFVVYQDGACQGAIADQRVDRPVGSCTNFKVGGLYGALILDEYNNAPGCSFKFWELADCHGKATVQHSSIYCTAIANKDGQFYLTNGAKSVSISC